MNVQRYLRMAHTSSVLVSLIINGLLILLLVTFITFQDQQERETSTVMVIDPMDKELIDEIEEEIEPEVVVDPETLDDFSDFNFDTPIDTAMEQSPEPIEEAVQTDVSSLSELMSDISSPVKMTSLLSGRTSVGRANALKQYGQGLGGVSEPAVLNALRWLKEQQHKDGSWGAEGKKGDSGHTGLALLAFLAHGETPASREFGATVANGIRFLVENQDSRGLLQPVGRHVVYAHAMATYALAESTTMTQNPLLTAPLERAVALMIESQHPRGGYEYEYEKSDTHDVSVDAWHVQALKAASIALPDHPKLNEYKLRAMEGMLLGSMKDDLGRGFGYRLSIQATPKASSRREILTAAGLLGMYLTGNGDRKETREILKYMERHTNREWLPEWGVSRIGSDEYGGELMFWYYAVQAFFQENRNGSNFRKFYPKMVEALVKNQADDGHWNNFSRESPEQGLVLDTSLSALALMVTYRYLPTTQAENISQPNPQPGGATSSAEEDVEFDI
ncbi:terpene cyclase/mutase family protein [Kiritimatiellaeota bacterium B1221]|nr:terpene cyclase/mutase family protein [Kiritimatiellaeota bacterium B1221]